jgi:hypothetical protein
MPPDRGYVSNTVSSGEAQGDETFQVHPRQIVQLRGFGRHRGR